MQSISTNIENGPLNNLCMKISKTDKRIFHKSIITILIMHRKKLL